MRFTTATRLVLDVIMSAPTNAPAWGYQIIDETGLGSGTVYPVLERLEDAGFVRAVWEDALPEDRPRRRFYEVTRDGRAWYVEHARRRRMAPAPTNATT